MIKRRFYKRGHGGDSSDSSSSDSGSDSIPDGEEDEEEELKKEGDEDDDDMEEEVAVERAKSEKKKKRNQRRKRSPSPASGYESEDSSVNEVKVNSSGLLTSEEDSIEGGGTNLQDGQLNKKAKTKETDQGASKSEERTLNSSDSIQSDFADYILQCKSVFKCRLCPRIVCLSEDTVMAHLNSKRHARSKKLLGEGRLKLMLNSDGEIEEDLETHAERHMRTVALAQEPVAPVKKDQGRQRQSQRRKKKQLRKNSNKVKPEESSKNRKKKQRKNEV